jgi:tRNA (guanine-N7-)-methyltransferase
VKIIFSISKEKKEFFRKRENQKFDDLEKDYYIWVHCASVGEINLSETLVKKLSEKRKEKILITCITDAGMKLSECKYSKYENIKLKYFPLDDKNQIETIINKFNSCLLLLIETELWPNLITCVNNMKHSKIALVNGRISDRSFKKYKTIKFILKNILNKIDYFYMQSHEDCNRIIYLGAKKENVVRLGNLKFDITFDNFNPKDINDYKEKLGISDKKIFVAGSTRTGEDEIILDTYSCLVDTVLILAPRHIERVPKIEKLIKEKGFSYKKYSEIKEKNQDSINIILVDTIGHLRKLYSICDIAFVGGTLVNVGGHSLLEPLFYRKTPIFGPYLQNVKDISHEILKKNIGYLIKNKEEFLKAIDDIYNPDNSFSSKEKIEEFINENKNITQNIFDNINNIKII